MAEQRWYAGVDWASESHHVFLTDSEGRKIGEKVFKHSGEGLAEMAAWLTAVSRATSPDQIHVAIEVPHGPVVETLIERSLKVHAINPKQMDRFRDRFTLAGAKDDSRDAEVMASALRTDPRCFRLLVTADPTVIELREWSRIAEDLNAERNRLTNRMREQLWRYFPAMLDLESDLGAAWLLDLWERAPTPNKAARIRETTVAKLLRRHRIRRFDAAHVLGVLRKPPLQVGAGTVEAAAAHMAGLIERIRLVDRQLKDAHRKLDVLTANLASSVRTASAGMGTCRACSTVVFSRRSVANSPFFSSSPTERLRARKRRGIRAARISVWCGQARTSLHQYTWLGINVLKQLLQHRLNP